MEVKKVIIIMRNDLVGYPPTISLIKTLLDIGVEVVYVGMYSDVEGKASLEKRGVEFVPIIYPNNNFSHNKILNYIKILYWQFRYKQNIKKYLSSIDRSGDELIWFVFSDAASLVCKYIMAHPYLVHFYEFDNPNLTWKNRFLNLSYKASDFLNGAHAIIHCEYNRAMIFNGLNGVKRTSYILPNKPYDNKDEGALPDEKTKELVASVKKRVEGKKVILYQGVFNTDERRLDEYCEAMKLLSNDYLFIIMGKLGKGLDYIKEKYSFDNIIFIPFVRPPYHLEITQLANYGILTYKPKTTDLYDVVNINYCAPNKIFEYGKYGIPMISNELPGLRQIFERFNCGKVIKGEITPEKIALIISEIDREYDNMSKGALDYYNSVNFESTVKNIIEGV